MSAPPFCFASANIRTNQFRSKIIALINSDSDDSMDFRLHLHHLQKSLEQHPITKGNPLSFANICMFDNNKKNSLYTYRSKTYKGVFDSSKRRTDNRFSVEAMRRDGSTIVKIEIQNCKEETLSTHPDFARCSDVDKEYLKKCLADVYPKKPVSILSKDARKGIHIHGDLYMVNDTTLIAQGIISMLYELRCKLFHGELDPTDSNSSIYCHAYHLLHHLIKELK